MFNAIASSVGSWRGIAILIVAWIVIAGIIQSVSPSIEEVSTNDQTEFLPNETEALQAIELEGEKFPAFEGLPAILIYRNPAGITDKDVAKVAEIDALIRADETHENVALVISDFGQSEFDGGAVQPSQPTEPEISPDGTAITITVVISGSPADDEFGETVEWLRELDDDVGVELPSTFEVTGPAGILADAIVVFQSFDFRVSAITIVLVLVILLAIYRSPLLALLPVVTVGVALTVAQSIAALLADNFELALNGQVTAIMAVLMFGAGTDFTLFIVSRYREELPVRESKFEAIAATMRAVGPSIASSAGTTVVAMMALALALSGSLKTMGPMLAMAVAVMLVCALTLIPAVLVAMGRVAFWPIKRVEPNDKESGIWNRVGRLVAKRPGTLLTITFVAMVALSAGLFEFTPRFSFVDGFPDSAESKTGFETLKSAYPPGELAPTTVYVSKEGVSVLDHLQAIEDLSAALMADPIVNSVTSITRPLGEPLPVDIAEVQPLVSMIPDDPSEIGALMAMLSAEQAQLAGSFLGGQRLVSTDRTTTKLEVVLNEDPYDIEAMDAVPRLRETVRDAVGASSLSGATAVVGGESATNYDSRTATIRDFQVIAPIVIAAIWVILAILLGSLVAPTYLVISVVLSFAAALGISIVIFENVFGHDGMAFDSIPFIFVFLIALGADYNIYIMSRVREETRTRGLAEGTRYAITRTGGVITSAGIILAGTFSVLTTFPLLDLFQLGFTVMLGILIDTFVVRAIMVPAIVMKLGEINWWPSKTPRAHSLAMERSSSSVKNSS
ncbi:MAG: MMPL family transporter [Chloroflexi bacterium]|nr:MMPL family transporter [Chloroflexota bacterium]MYK61792.1 MMPL family transporter [Chloroflexota bacterium]